MSALPEHFDVAFSFAGEQRPLVQSIAEAVKRLLQTQTVFYDAWFEEHIAGFDADLALEHIYYRAKLIVVCISERYGNKEWTQVEWSAIRAIYMKLRVSPDENDRLRILPIRVGDGEVKGISINAICPDVRQRTPDEAAQLIVNRLSLIQPVKGLPSLGDEKAKAIQNPIAAPRRDRGTMAEDNPWYVERKVDDKVFRALGNYSRTVSITGLPQSGKSSMAIRVGKRLRDQGYVEVVLYLKTALGDGDFANIETFFSALAREVAEKLGKQRSETQGVDSPETLAGYLRTAASNLGGKFLLTLLGFDHVFSKPTSLSIQSHLRVLHNVGAAAALQNLRLILVHTRRPPKGDSPLGSVFDVAEKFKAADFDLRELRHLVSMYGNYLDDEAIVGLHRLLAGHPAYSRRALDHMVEENQSFEEFREDVETSGGIFEDDLRRVLLEFTKPGLTAHRPALARAMHRAPSCGDELDYEVLHALGLVNGTFSGDAVPRCAMFEKWFSKRVPKP